MTYTLDTYFKKAGLKMTVPFAPYIAMDPEKLPRKHQIKGLNKLLTNDYYGLYDQPGTGKTLTVHAYALYWISEGQKVIAVMPPNLVYQFREELHEIYIGSEKFIDCHILDQSPAKRRKLYAEWKKEKSWPQIICMSYQMFSREREALQKQYKVGIFDEAQALKSSVSGFFKNVHEWQHQKGGTAGVFMTGTPIHNEMIDAYSLIELTDPGRYKSFNAFDAIHCIYKKIPLKTPRRMKNGMWQRSFRVRSGYRKTRELSKALYKNARRTLKKDVVEIQDPTITEVAVKLETAHITLYKRLVKERLLEVGDEMIIADNAQALRQKCLQIVTCPELFIDGEMKFKNNIVRACKEIIDGMEIKESKVIIFSNYQDSVRNLAEYFKDFNPALMYGGSNTEKNRQKFLKDDTCRLLIANPKSAGAGFNFQKECHTVIFAEPTGVPGDFKQCMDRVARSGQKKLVNVWVIKALNTISPKATEEMLRKENEAQTVYHDKYTFLSDFKAA